MRSKFWSIIATISCGLVVLLVAACGGGDDNTKTTAPTTTQTQSSNGGGNTAAASQTAKATATQASNGAIDACSVLTAGEVSAVISETASDGIPMNDAPQYQCEWENADETTEVFLTLYNDGSESGAQSEYDILDSGSEAVSGLGDKAHWVSLNDTLEVLKGKYVVEIQVVDFKSGADSETEAKTLASKVLARLP